MTERILDFKWINRAHNPHPREFIGGYHTGAVCKHTKKGKLLPMEKRKYLSEYRGKDDPSVYRNSLYSNPLLHTNGYHERHFLLTGREYWMPVCFDKPYYIEQVTLNDTITRHDLARRNPNNSIVLANRLNDVGKYNYMGEPLYQEKQRNEALKLAAVEKKNEYVASKAIAQKEGLFKAVDRNDRLKTKPVAPIVSEAPIYREDVNTVLPTSTTIYESVPMTATTQQILTTQEPIITETIQPTIVDAPLQQSSIMDNNYNNNNLASTTTTTTTTTSTGTSEAPPIYKEEVVLVPLKESIQDDITPGNNSEISYSEITQVPIQMTSSEFGGGGTPKSSGSGRRNKKGNKKQQQTYRKEIITKKSTDGGKTFTNDSTLAGENVEYIEEQTTISNLN